MTYIRFIPDTLARIKIGEHPFPTFWLYYFNPHIAGSFITAIKAIKKQKSYQTKHDKIEFPAISYAIYASHTPPNCFH